MAYKLRESTFKNALRSCDECECTFGTIHGAANKAETSFILDSDVGGVSRVGRWCRDCVAVYSVSLTVQLDSATLQRTVVVNDE